MEEWHHCPPTKQLLNHSRQLERELAEAKAEITVLRARTQRTYHANHCKLMQYETSPGTECSCGFSRASEAQSIQAQLTAHKAALEKCEKLIKRAEHAAYCDHALPGPHAECSCGLEKTLAEIAKLRGGAK